MDPSCVSVTFSSMVVILLSHLPRTDNPLDIPTLLLFPSTESCISRWETVSHSGSWTPCFIPNYWYVGVQMFACSQKILCVFQKQATELQAAVTLCERDSRRPQSPFAGDFFNGKTLQCPKCHALHSSNRITRSSLAPYPLATDHGVWFRQVSMTLLVFRPTL
jgi:hypothetical protein